MQASKIAYIAIFLLGIIVGIVFGQFLTVNVAQAASTLYSNTPVLTQETSSDLFFTPTVSGTLLTAKAFEVGCAACGLSTSSTMVVTLANASNTLDYDCTTGAQTLDYFGIPVHTSAIYSNMAEVTFVFSGAECNLTAGTSYVLNSSLGGSVVAGAGAGVAYYNSYLVVRDYVDTVIPTNSVITIMAPLPYGTTTASTTVKTSAFFFYTAPSSTTTRAEIKIYDAVTNELEDSVFQLVPAGFDVSFQLEYTFTLATGSKKMISSYVVAGSNIDLLTPKEHFFNVIDNSYLLATGLDSPQSNPADLTQINCDTFDIGCQFQKALVFLFVPSQTVLNKFSSGWQELQYLKPFGYITIAIQRLNSVSATGVGAYTMPSIPFITSIFEPLRNTMAIILWGIFAFIFYNKRVKNIDI